MTQGDHGADLNKQPVEHTLDLPSGLPGTQKSRLCPAFQQSGSPLFRRSSGSRPPLVSWPQPSTRQTPPGPALPIARVATPPRTCVLHRQACDKELELGALFNPGKIRKGTQHGVLVIPSLWGLSPSRSGSKPASPAREPSRYAGYSYPICSAIPPRKRVRSVPKKGLCA
eukprot:scaffold952_cov409-Prasinococcus_capsulatus_cf.AAC.61